MVTNFTNSELKDLLEKKLDTILHVIATTINISSIVLSTLAGIIWAYLAFAAVGCSSGTVLFSAAIKTNTQAMTNNNTNINNLLKTLKINET